MNISGSTPSCPASKSASASSHLPALPSLVIAAVKLRTSWLLSPASLLSAHSASASGAALSSPLLRCEIVLCGTTGRQEPLTCRRSAIGNGLVTFLGGTFGAAAARSAIFIMSLQPRRDTNARGSTASIGTYTYFRNVLRSSPHNTYCTGLRFYLPSSASIQVQAVGR